MSLCPAKDFIYLLVLKIKGMTELETFSKTFFKKIFINLFTFRTKNESYLVSSVKIH